MPQTTSEASRQLLWHLSKQIPQYFRKTLNMLEFEICVIFRCQKYFSFKYVPQPFKMYKNGWWLGFNPWAMISSSLYQSKQHAGKR